MGTKNNPGKFDCYASAEPDEPMFILLARDEKAPMAIRGWVLKRARDRMEQKGRDTDALFELTPTPESVRSALLQLNELDAKAAEALDCADAMEQWRENRPGT